MSDKYAEALEELDRMKAAGQVSQAQYDLHRSKLLAEASQPRKTMVTRIVLFLVIVALLFVLLRVVLALIS